MDSFGRAAEVDQHARASYIRGMDIGTRLFTALRGRLVGRDAPGNRYFEDRRGTLPGRAHPRRWVMYAGVPDASAVPAEWHSWLHYTTEAPIPQSARRPWQLPHLANQTGTENAYRPAGHDYRGGNRAVASADYESWTPGS